MMQELNLTPTQTLILFIVLGDTQAPKLPQNANYGAYIQSQNHYYN
ncbi:hypothetical protein OM834_06565 [Streptococcus agalactiae]